MQWVLGEQLVGHKNAVSAITSTKCKDEESGEMKIILASSSADSTVLIWKQSESLSGNEVFSHGLTWYVF